VDDWVCSGVVRLEDRPVHADFKPMDNIDLRTIRALDSLQPQDVPAAAQLTMRIDAAS
jgi:hypothetical protein